MKVAGKFAGRIVKFVLSAFALSASIAAPVAQAQTQGPYLIPYTIQVLAGGGTSVAVPTAPPGPLSTPCTGAGQTGAQYDNFGDGCSVASSSVVVGAATDIHDVVVDQQGNVYFLDNGASNAVIRRIDARSGIITVYAGSFSTTQPPCSTTIDKYGDTCQANDGKANFGTLVTANGTTTVVPGGFTGGFAKARGLAIARNGDVILAQYSGNVVNRISAQTGVMTLVAGLLGGGTVAKPTGNIGQKGYTGDGTAAVGAAVNSARGAAVDNAGNIYIADSGNNVVRKITASTGNISTIVGAYPGSNTNAVAGATGDGGPAGAALLSSPEDLSVDQNGNLFIADAGNNRLRVVYQGGAVVANLIARTNPGTAAVVGNIYTVAGGGTATYVAGTVVPAQSITISGPRKIDIDSRGNLFLADSGNAVIWFVDATTGYIRVVAGSFGLTAGGAGCSAKVDAFGDNCPATTATFFPNSAMAVSVDTIGNLYVTDPGDARLRKVLTNQSFPATTTGTTVSQVLQVHFAAGDGPAATGYSISGSKDFTLAAGTVLCTVNADLTQDCLVPVNFKPSFPGNDIATLTVASLLNGSSAFGISGIGLGASIALDPGATSSFATGLTNPAGIAQDGAGNVYIADTGKNRILKFAAAGAPVVIAGTGTVGYTGDNGLATAATLSAPKAITITRSGLIYIADTGNNVIRAINPTTNTISTVGGGATAVCASALDTFGDGCPATAAIFKAPAGLAADTDGNVYVSDSGNGLIREIAGGTVYLVGGGASAVCAAGDVFGNGCPGNGATFNNPTGIQLDASRNIFIADTNDNQVREIAVSTNKVINIAGTGFAGSSGNGGTATSAQLSAPTGVAVDAAGDVYIADTGNAVIRLVNSLGTINTTVGTLGAPGTGILPGSAFAVQLATPAGVVSNGAGRLVVLDSGNGRVFVDDRGSVTQNFGRTNLGASSPTLQIQETSTGSNAATLSSSSSTGIFTPTPAAPFSLAGTGSTGCSAGQSLAPGTSCLLFAQFTPTTLGNFSNTYTESTTNTINSPVPFIQLLGVGAVLTPTTSATLVTTPATGNPQYSIPFTVTTTVTPASCNTAAPTCLPTGTVTFFVDGTQIGLPIAVSGTTAATASASISGLGVGRHTVVAVYNGDSFYASSTAATLSVTVTQGTTTTVVTLSPASGAQFTAFNLSAKVSSATASLPIGSVSFYANGTTLLGTSSINAQTGVANLLDTLVGATALTPAYYSNYGLPAGTYTVTAVYGGNANYATSTSTPATLTISADAAAITIVIGSPAVGTAQGSTISTLATVFYTNTVNGALTFSCTNLPANSICTFQPTSFTTVATPGVPVGQSTTVTLWTDVPPGVIPTAAASLRIPGVFGSANSGSELAALLGWPVLLSSLVGIFGFRRRLQKTRLLAVLALLGALVGGTSILTGCSGNKASTAVTPVGTYTVNLVVTGSNGVKAQAPIQFTVGQGAPGQL